MRVYAEMVRRLIKAGMLPGKALDLVASTYRVSKKEIIKVLED